MMNGAQNHQRFGNMQMHKQHQQQHFGPHGPISHHNSGHHQGAMHQHNISGGFSNAAHHALGFQDHIVNGNSDNISHDENEDLDNEHWKEQHQVLNDCRELSGPNQRARQVAATARGISYIGADDGNTDRIKKTGITSGSKSDWDELDLGGQGLHAISPILFNAYGFIRRLDLGFNSLTYLPSSIGQLKTLEHLDVSFNSLHELPAEIGMLTNLKQLLLFNNRIQTLCYELGYLFKLDVLGVLGNPLEAGQKEKITEGGTKALIHHLRESMPGKCLQLVVRILLICPRSSAAPRACLAPARRHSR
jgi:CCR4-NOT transcription complex subunit 6